MITNYLIELLKDNECVIVPEFGAFISKRHSAAIDYANHRFTPPYKEIVFNNKLKNDDELLVSFLSEKENISKEDALVKIKSFANQSEAILDVNSELNIEGLGKLRKFGDDYVLTTTTELNLLGDSYGLTEFNIQPVFRTETYQVIKERIVVEQKEKNTGYVLAVENIEDAPNAEIKRKPSFVKSLTFTTLVFLLLFAINWKTEQADSNFASWNPFLYSSPNEFFINFIESENVIGQQTTDNSQQSLVVESENVFSQQTTDNSQQSLVVESENVLSQQTIDNSQQSLVVESENVEVHHYFIIGGSFQTIERAEVCLNDIKNQGFENASIIEKNDRIRVCYESFANKSDALIRLETIKHDFNESAWLLFQK